MRARPRIALQPGWARGRVPGPTNLCLRPYRVSYTARTRYWCATENVRPQPGGPGRVMRSCCGESASHFCGICATARNPGSNMVRLVHVTTVPESLTFFHGQVGYLRPGDGCVGALLTGRAARPVCRARGRPGSRPGDAAAHHAAARPGHDGPAVALAAPGAAGHRQRPRRRRVGCSAWWGRGWRECRCGSTTCTACLS